MSWRTEDDKFRKPKEVFPKITDVIKNHEFWNKRRITYLGDHKYFDQEVRTGVCYFCKREGRAQKSKITNLHHAKYDHSDPLAWTIEVCQSCHWHIDEDNRKVIARSTGREITPRKQPFYENSEQRMKREKREKEFWFLRYCSNLGPGNYVPIKRLIPDQETYDKVVEAIKKASSKRDTMSKDTMSNVTRRYY